MSEAINKVRQNSTIGSAIHELVEDRVFWGDSSQPEDIVLSAEHANNVHGAVYREGAVRRISRATEFALHATVQRRVERAADAIGFVS